MHNWLIRVCLMILIAGSVSFISEAGDPGVGSVELVASDEDPGDGGVGDVQPTSNEDPGDGGVG